MMITGYYRSLTEMAAKITVAFWALIDIDNLRRLPMCLPQEHIQFNLNDYNNNSKFFTDCFRYAAYITIFSDIKDVLNFTFYTKLSGGYKLLVMVASKVDTHDCINN